MTAADPALALAVAPDLERQVFRKIGWRLLPVLTLAYLVNYLDRTNIAFAGLTMNHELGLTASQFGYGAGVLFIGYCGFGLPANILMYRFGPRRWISGLLVVWGIVSACQILAKGPLSFYIARFLLGAAEAGFLWTPARTGNPRRIPAGRTSTG